MANTSLRKVLLGGGMGLVCSASISVAQIHGIPVEAHNITAERMKRWYGMGHIRVADFDGDGQVMLTDEVMAANAVYEAMQYRLSHGVERWPTVFGQGDINNDGIINQQDMDFFYEYYNETNGHTRAEKFNYFLGNPNNR